MKFAAVPFSTLPHRLLGWTRSHLQSEIRYSAALSGATGVGLDQPERPNRLGTTNRRRIAAFTMGQLRSAGSFH